MVIGPWELHHTAATHREDAQHPVPGQTLGNPEAVVDVGVEALHGPHGVLLQLAVQGVLLLHALETDSRGTTGTQSRGREIDGDRTAFDLNSLTGSNGGERCFYSLLHDEFSLFCVNIRNPLDQTHEIMSTEITTQKITLWMTDRQLSKSPYKLSVVSIVTLFSSAVNHLTNH